MPSAGEHLLIADINLHSNARHLVQVGSTEQFSGFPNWLSGNISWNSPHHHFFIGLESWLKLSNHALHYFWSASSALFISIRARAAILLVGVLPRNQAFEVDWTFPGKNTQPCLFHCCWLRFAVLLRPSLSSGTLFFFVLFFIDANSSWNIHQTQSRQANKILDILWHLNQQLKPIWSERNVSYTNHLVIITSKESF